LAGKFAPIFVAHSALPSCLSEWPRNQGKATYLLPADPRLVYAESPIKPPVDFDMGNGALATKDGNGLGAL
jgi:hypothetical protein